MRYIDAYKLITEIEREQRKLTVLSSQTRQLDMKRDCALQNGVYVYILGVITSLQQEQPKVDLEKEIEKQWEKCNPVDEGMGVESAYIHIEAFDIIARHFAEWGAIHLNARKEEQI